MFSPFHLLFECSAFYNCGTFFLSHVSVSLLKVLKLRQRTIVPQETIIRCGDIGREMFLLDKGEVEILDSDEKVATRLFPGSFFGEISKSPPFFQFMDSVMNLFAFVQELNLKRKGGGAFHKS